MDKSKHNEYLIDVKNAGTDQLSLGNGNVMELKIIKHDEASKDLAGC